MAVAIITRTIIQPLAQLPMGYSQAQDKMISAYFRWLTRIIPKSYKVIPIERASDSAYENEEKEKGKRTFLEKSENTKKFPEENSTMKRRRLSIWV